MDDITNYTRDTGYNHEHRSGEANYLPTNRLSGLRSSRNILPSKPHPSNNNNNNNPPMRSFRDSASPMESVDSLLGGGGGGAALISDARYEDGKMIDDAAAGHSAKIQVTPNPVDQLSMKTRGVQLPVKHSSGVGTQVGILLPKYHVHPQSKCIMCRDCGIFFSHDAFLRHLHNDVGRRTECQSAMLELGIDNPGVHQLKVWEDFLAKLRGGGGEGGVSKRPRTASYNPTSSTEHHNVNSADLRVQGSHLPGTDLHPSSRQPLQPYRPIMHHSPRTSTMHTMHHSQTLPASQTHLRTSSAESRANPSSSLHIAPQPQSSMSQLADSSTGAQPSSMSDFNKNIQRTVDASERLLKETSHYLASTEKSRHHRRNRSANHDLKTEPSAGDSRPHASRNLFTSTRQQGNLGRPAMNDHPDRDLRTSATKGSPDRELRTGHLAQDLRTTTSTGMQPLNPDRQHRSERLDREFRGSQTRQHTRGEEEETEAADDPLTAHFPQDTRMFADGGGDPSNSHDIISQHRLNRGGGDPPTSSNDIASAQQRLNPGGGGGVSRDSGARTLFDLRESSSLRLNFPQVLNGEGRTFQDQRDGMKKEDPLFILQTAQELLALASHRIQTLTEDGAMVSGPPPSPGRDNEFLKLYHEERSKRRKFEGQIQELQDSLKEEQRQRKELEIQLRALKLQR